jgi:hypothetical protein
MFFIEKINRRTLLIGLGFANVLTLISYVVFDRLTYLVNNDFKYGCVGSLIAYSITYGGGLGPIAFFISSELTPHRFRSLVQSFVFAMNTIINFIISFGTLPLYRLIDIWAFIPLFVIPSSISLVYLYFNMPETRGREVHEIVNSLMPRRQRLPSSTNELVAESGLSSSKSNFTEDTLSSTEESEDDEQLQRQPLNFASNLCLAAANSAQLKPESDKVLIEKF